MAFQYVSHFDLIDIEKHRIAFPTHKGVNWVWEQIVERVPELQFSLSMRWHWLAKLIGWRVDWIESTDERRILRLVKRNCFTRREKLIATETFDLVKKNA